MDDWQRINILLSELNVAKVKLNAAELENRRLKLANKHMRDALDDVGMYGTAVSYEQIWDRAKQGLKQAEEAMKLDLK